MSKDSKSFWDFPPCAKHDEIVEGRHDHLYYGALADKSTGIEKMHTDTYILYGPSEALLIRPARTVFKLGLELVGAFLSLKRHA